MNRTSLLKASATIAITLIIGVLMLACSSQTTSSNSSESIGPHSFDSELSSSSANADDDERATSGDSASKTLACIGDSITYGYGLDYPDEQSWPALLQARFGDEWRVVNLGVVGSTLVDEGWYPYRSTGNVERAKEFGADLYVIMLGTNDAADPALDIESYRTQLTALVDELSAAASQDAPSSEAGESPTQPQFVLMAPPCTFFYLADDPGADEFNRAIGEDIRNAVQSVAAEKGAQFIDLYALTEHHPEWFPDYLHPNADGHVAIADYLYEQVFNNSDA